MATRHEIISIDFRANAAKARKEGKLNKCIIPIIDQDGDSIPVKIAGLLGMEMEPVGSFEYFLPGCRMLYDYQGQRIIAYNPGYSYAYIYSLESNKWGMMQSSIKDGIRSYPECLAVDGSNNIIDLSSAADSDTSPVNALLITRPLKLDAPDVLKTIDTIIQRGQFRKGSVQTILYGSRDLFNWHLVSSSVDHYLRGFRGTPYKYFRIVLLCSLQKDESIFGCTIGYTPRLTNEIR